MNPGEFNKAHLVRRLNQSAIDFEHANFVHRKAADGLLLRTEPVAIKPRCVVDLGCALGDTSQRLSKRYRGSLVVGVDLSAPMLRQARQNKGWLSKRREVQGDATQLPFRTGSVDIVVANMLLPFVDDSRSAFLETGRVLRKDGLFAFSTLGPSSFGEIRSAWAEVDNDVHVRDFADMHEIGDALVAAGMRDPVLDVDYVTVTYKSVAALFRDLGAVAARNSLAGRRKSLTGKSRLQNFERAIASFVDDGLLRLQLELVFGHAFGGGPAQKPGEYRLSPDAIGRRIA